jgi:hypothetical protein
MLGMVQMRFGAASYRARHIKGSQDFRSSFVTLRVFMASTCHKHPFLYHYKSIERCSRSSCSPSISRSSRRGLRA